MDMLFVLAQAATQATTQAADATAPAETFKQWYQSGLLGWYLTGGWFMIPLFFCQVIALGVIIERWGVLRSLKIDTTAFRNKVRSLLSRSQVDEAIQVCDDTPGPVAATLAVGLRRFKLLKALGRSADQIEGDVSKSIDDYGPHLVAILERHIPLLATVAALGPLFGFLGTVDGMVTSFGAIEAAAGSGNIVRLAAGGIRVALYTTIMGLCIGIVAQWAYNSFTNRVNGIVLEVEESASELIHNLAILSAVGGESLSDDEPAPAPRAAPAPVAR